MTGTRWYSFKHNSYATVSIEPVSKHGYYLIEFDNGLFRRYSAKRIQRECTEHKSIDTQLAMQGIPAMPVTMPIAVNAPQAASGIIMGIIALGEPITASVAPQRKAAGILIGLVFEGKQ